MSNKIGRKKCLILYAIVSICGWLILITNFESLAWSILGRFLQGFGFVVSIGQVYLVEVLDVQKRESLGTILSVSINIGITLSYVLGMYFHWSTVAWIFVGVNFLQILFWQLYL